MVIKETFQTQSLDISSHRDIIYSYMLNNGYNVEYCSICSVEVLDQDDDYKIVKFKFVHNTVPSMVTEPYYVIVINRVKERKPVSSECTLCGRVKYTSECICEIE